MIGLNSARSTSSSADYPLGELLKDTAAIALTVIVIRVLWVFPATYLPPFMPSLRQRHPVPPWRQVALIAWAGIRGVDSLATALAVPLVISAGRPFPQRDLVIFLSFGVILSTLVLQGMSLPLLIRWLGLRDDGLDESEEMKGRSAATEAALRRLDELANEPWAPRESVERLRVVYRARLRRYQSRLRHDACEDHYEENAEAVRRLRNELLKAERQAVLEQRDHARSSTTSHATSWRDIDLELRQGRRPRQRRVSAQPNFQSAVPADFHIALNIHGSSLSDSTLAACRNARCCVMLCR